MSMWKDVDDELAAVKAERDGYREALEKIFDPCSDAQEFNEPEDERDLVRIYEDIAADALGKN